MQRATVDLPEPLSPTMPSVRPLRRVSVTFWAAATSRAAAEERALAIDLAEFVGFQHDRFAAMPARGARGTRLGTAESRLRVYSCAGLRRMASSGPCLDQSALPHHGDAVGDLGDHAHIMGDEQHGGAVIALQVADQASGSASAW